MGGYEDYFVLPHETFSHYTGDAHLEVRGEFAFSRLLRGAVAVFDTNAW